MILLFGLMMGSAFAYDDDQENDFFGGFFSFFASFFEDIMKAFLAPAVVEETGTVGYHYGTPDDSSSGETEGNLVNDSIGTAIPEPEPTTPENPLDSLLGNGYPYKSNPKTCYDYCYNYHGQFSWTGKGDGEFIQEKFDEAVLRCERVRTDSIANCYYYSYVKCLEKEFDGCMVECQTVCAATGEYEGSDWACRMGKPACSSICQEKCESGR